MPAILVEYNFVTNAKDNELFDKNLDKYAEETVKALESVLGKAKANTSNDKPVVDTNTDTKDKVLYKVQLGAFKDKYNAYKFLENVKKSYFDAFVVKTDLYRVQVGAFANKVHADNLLKSVKILYSDAFITTGVASTTTSPKKTINVVAKEVINGDWGNGTGRKEKLEKAGYNYSEVQAEVNRLLKG